MALPGMEWLYGVFGSRRLIGCKESTDALYQGMADPVNPYRLEVDKRLDQWFDQPFYAIQQTGIVGTMATWGRPMSPYRVGENPDAYLPIPTLTYVDYGGQIRDDGTYVSTPIDVGSIVRTMAADMMANIQTMYAKNR